MLHADSSPQRGLAAIRGLNREELTAWFESAISSMNEAEALAVLANPFCTSELCEAISQTQRLTSFYSICVRLVAHRATPQVHAMRFVHHLFWPDLLRLSVDVRIHPSVRHMIERQLVTRVAKRALGEKISAARICGRDLIGVMIHDPSPRVFGALLVNARLREDDLTALIGSGRASVEKLVMIGDDMRWSSRYEIRLALVRNVSTPRAIAARQLRFLKRQDLEAVLENEKTTVYVRRCIEKLIEPGAGGDQGALVE